MKKKLYVELLDINDSVIQNIQLNEIPLKEEYILNISKEEYENDEPCVVIRTCIRNNVYRKFLKYIKSINKKLECKIYVKDLPIEFRESMDILEDVVSIKCKQSI